MNETEEEKDSEWAKIRAQLAQDGATVMHIPTRVIGKVEKFYDGDADKWQDPNGVYLVTPVLKLTNGHAFSAIDQKDFLPLTEMQAGYYHAATEDMAVMVAKLAMIAAQAKMPMEETTVLLSSMLREQARALDLAARRSVKG